MAIKDVFNNSTDNYLKTGLTPCTSPDTNIFQFFPKKEVGVSNGSQILQIMNLGDIQVEIDAWDQNKKILGPGEVTFIAGLTKELDHRSQAYNFGYDVPDASLLYMGAGIVINYNQNFKNITTAIDVISDPSAGISLENAINLKLSSLNIGATASIDSSIIYFNGVNPGYDFNVTDVSISNYDASMNINGVVFSIVEDSSKSIEYAKYINGAMLGVVLKATYPISESTYDKWLYISHVNNTFSYWDDPDYLTKLVDTGSSSSSTATTMSAGDYLNYITVNDEWDKIGYLYMKINTFDQDDNAQKNLVPGFYVFNPHGFSVTIDYLMIN